MKKPPEFIIHGCCLLLLTTILGVGWWLAGRSTDGTPLSSLFSSDTARTKRSPAARGPQDPAWCATPGVPLPPPPIDNPFGLHLYATTPKGVITQLQAAEIVNYLGLPDATNASSPSPASTSPSLAPAYGSSASPAKNETAYDDVQSVSMLLQEYRRAFGAMPVGELNDEIVRRLQGENPKGIAVLPRTHAAINGQGELMDRWGTPYRFHPESAWDMTVRSAGPDKKMWTGDDVLSEGLSGVMVQR